MSTFRTCWRVLFAQRTMILVYIVYLSLMMFGLSWSIIQNLSNTDNSTTYETLRPEVAVVDRNGGVGSGFSDSLRKFLSKDCDLVDVGTTSQDLQTAAASNYADLIVIIPEHYVDDLAAAFTSDSAVPELQMVTSFTGAYGSLAKLQVEDFLNLTRMTALADAASSGSSVSVASLNAAAGSVIADLTGNADAYPQIAIAEDPAGTDDREANGRYAFQTMMDMGAYPMVAAMFTITAMTMGSFSGARGTQTHVCLTATHRFDAVPAVRLLWLVRCAREPVLSGARPGSSGGGRLADHRRRPEGIPTVRIDDGRL